VFYCPSKILSRRCKDSIYCWSFLVQSRASKHAFCKFVYHATPGYVCINTPFFHAVVVSCGLFLNCQWYYIVVYRSWDFALLFGKGRWFECCNFDCCKIDQFFQTHVLLVRLLPNRGTLISSRKAFFIVIYTSIACQLHYYSTLKGWAYDHEFEVFWFYYQKIWNYRKFLWKEIQTNSKKSDKNLQTSWWF